MTEKIWDQAAPNVGAFTTKTEPTQSLEMYPIPLIGIMKRNRPLGDSGEESKAERAERERERVEGKKENKYESNREKGAVELDELT